jgi:uncharacterized protein DUF4167
VNENRGKGRYQRTSAAGDQRRTAPQQQHRTRVLQSGRPNNTASNAKRNYEHYIVLAKEAARTGATIEAENYYQHAEHYFRVMRGDAS